MRASFLDLPCRWRCWRQCPIRFSFAEFGGYSRDETRVVVSVAVRILPVSCQAVPEGFGAFPVAGDLDDDGLTDIAIYRPELGQWWINRSCRLIVHTFGNSADRCVQGDYPGGGKADVSILRPSGGEWLILKSEDLIFYSFPLVVSTGLPVPGDPTAKGNSIPAYSVRGQRPGTSRGQPPACLCRVSASEPKSTPFNRA